MAFTWMVKLNTQLGHASKTTVGYSGLVRNLICPFFSFTCQARQKSQADRHVDSSMDNGKYAWRRPWYTSNQIIQYHARNIEERQLNVVVQRNTKMCGYVGRFAFESRLLLAWPREQRGSRTGRSSSRG